MTKYVNSAKAYTASQNQWALRMTWRLWRMYLVMWRSTLQTSPPQCYQVMDISLAEISPPRSGSHGHHWHSRSWLRFSGQWLDDEIFYLKSHKRTGLAAKRGLSWHMSVVYRRIHGKPQRGKFRTKGWTWPYSWVDWKFSFEVITFPVFANGWMIIIITYVFYIFLFNL